MPRCRKLFGSEIQQRIEELALELEGPYAQLFRDPLVRSPQPTGKIASSTIAR
jgi:hypothetical protein